MYDKNKTEEGSTNLKLISLLNLIRIRIVEIKSTINNTILVPHKNSWIKKSWKKNECLNSATDFCGKSILQK